MSDRIRPENNRTFKTGSGTWTGNFVWHSDTLDFHQGYITVEIPPGGGPKTISLAYPAIIPRLDFTGGFGAAALDFNQLVAPTLFDWMITDGVYTAWNDTWGIGGDNLWLGIGGIYSVPADWNLYATVLTLTCYNPSGLGGKVAFDDFSLSPPIEKSQYLPVMGIG